MSPRRHQDDPSRNRNYYNFFKDKIAASIGRYPFVALIALILTLLFIAVESISTLKQGYLDTKTFFRSEKIKEITHLVPGNNLLKNDDLFHNPFLFYKRGSIVKLKPNQMVDMIEFSNQDIYINITTVSNRCSKRYIICNNKNSVGGVTHEIIPQYLFSNENKSEDY